MAISETQLQLGVLLALDSDIINLSGWRRAAVKAGVLKKTRTHRAGMQVLLTHSKALKKDGLVVQRGLTVSIGPAAAMMILQLAEQEGLSKFLDGVRSDSRGELRLAIVLKDRKRLSVQIRSVFPGMAAERLFSSIGFARPEWLDLFEPAVADVRDRYVVHMAKAARDMLLRLEDGHVTAFFKYGAGPEVVEWLVWTERDDGVAVDTETLPLLLLLPFRAGDHAQVRALGSVAKQARGTGTRPLPGLSGALLALCQASDPSEWRRLQADLAGVRNDLPYRSIYRMIGVFLQQMRQRGSRGVEEIEVAQYDPIHEGYWFHFWVAALLVGWADMEGDRSSLIEDMISLSKSAEENECGWLWREFEATKALLQGRTPDAGTVAAAYTPASKWEHALNQLQAAVPDASVHARSPNEKNEARILWELRLKDGGVDIRPRMAATTRSKRGKIVALNKLVKRYETILSQQDYRIYNRIQRIQYSAKIFLGRHALTALIGHPEVTLKDGTRVSVEHGQPYIDVQARHGDDGDVHSLTFSPKDLRHFSVVAEYDTQKGVVHVFERTPEMENIVDAFTDGTIDVPASGKEQLSQVVADLSKVVGIRAAANVDLPSENVDCSARPTLVLGFARNMLSVDAMSQPLGEAGPQLAFAQPPARVFAYVNGRPLSTDRSIAEENEQLQAVLTRCPTLHQAWDERYNRADFFDPFQQREVLFEISQLAEQVVVLWPKGKKLQSPVVFDKDALRLKVTDGTEWFGLSASFQFDEQRVMDLSELLERRSGRYIKLDAERIVALSDDLLRRVDMLEALRNAKSGEAQLPIMALPLLEDLGAGTASFNIDEATKKRLADLSRSMKQRPRVPASFKGTLRDYQKVGFTWMMRLAGANLGALLADDMGLGKTIQTLAVLAARKTAGPALMVAPASVVANWRAETARFVPSLRVHILGEMNSDERANCIASLKSGDLLLCTYGRLVTESEALGDQRFGTLIFDEAHYLKNTTTRRAKAARALNGGFRISLTGTPIENHLGELYNLMQVTVPGLLGSQREFISRYAEPIAKGDRTRVSSLRTLLDPFLLRRTKSEVLGELPERTDITWLVEPTKDERAFYEAARRKASEKLEGSIGKNGKPAKAGRIQILAELTRLRQAAVDPRVLNKNAPPGAKIPALVERLSSLKAEGHRALVFSQFLGGMQLVCEGLEDAGLSFLRLDGSTPAKKRKDLIASFQEGHADVFVMSLKAGGIGVNLTGADYVIHLDPWWNPAVEEQASARSHRMGQKRPVTVYRLITEGTIEEKILALHEKKRALADDLLMNMDKAKKLDLEALRGLL